MSTPDGWTIVQLLAEPTRRRVLETVRCHDGPVTRETVAADAEINERLAAFHLDRLAAAGLLDVHYARPEGRSGPGAGRPAKRYWPADVQLDLTVPRRQYSLAARILASGIGESGEDAAEACRAAAYREGRQVGESARRPRRSPMKAVQEALATVGYEPHQGTSAAVLRLRNCPFDDVVTVNRELVCGVNREFVRGVIDGVGARRCEARPDGQQPDCCVTVRRT
jgi:predicted ArsR family transcriptional regulator